MKPIWKGGEMRVLFDKIARRFGMRLVDANLAYFAEKPNSQLMVYQHEYEGGYDEYRDLQIHHNKRKLDNVWADEETLGRIAKDLAVRSLTGKGICHGARNGFEVEWFRKNTPCDVIGTDISETATQFPNMVVWDFQDENPDWADQFDMIYTNSLDQAMDPARALASWTKQLSPDGCIYVEHTLAHSAGGASEMDPFGAHPLAMPYLFFTWGKENYALADIFELERKANFNIQTWVFVLKRA